MSQSIEVHRFLLFYFYFHKAVREKSLESNVLVYIPAQTFNNFFVPSFPQLSCRAIALPHMIEKIKFHDVYKLSGTE